MKLTANQIKKADAIRVSTNAIKIRYQGNDYMMACRERGKWIWVHPEMPDEGIPATKAQIAAALNR